MKAIFEHCLHMLKDTQNTLQLHSNILKLFRKGKDVMCGQVWWPLHLTHPSSHSSEHTLTMNTHPVQWAASPAAPGEQLEVWRLALGSQLSRGIEGRESAGHSPPPDNSCRIWDSNPKPLGYKSYSLSIRPRQILNLEHLVFRIMW